MWVQRLVYDLNFAQYNQTFERDILIKFGLRLRSSYPKRTKLKDPAPMS